MSQHQRRLRRIARELESRCIMDGTVPMFALCLKGTAQGPVVTVHVMAEGAQPRDIRRAILKIADQIRAKDYCDTDLGEALPVDLRPMIDFPMPGGLEEGGEG